MQAVAQEQAADSRLERRVDARLHVARDGAEQQLHPLRVRLVYGGDAAAALSHPEQPPRPQRPPDLGKLSKSAAAAGRHRLGKAPHALLNVVEHLGLQRRPGYQAGSATMRTAKLPAASLALGRHTRRASVSKRIRAA